MLAKRKGGERRRKNGQERGRKEKATIFARSIVRTPENVGQNKGARYFGLVETSPSFLEDIGFYIFFPCPIYCHAIIQDIACVPLTERHESQSKKKSPAQIESDSQKSPHNSPHRSCWWVLFGSMHDFYE